MTLQADSGARDSGLRSPKQGVVWSYFEPTNATPCILKSDHTHPMKSSDGQTVTTITAVAYGVQPEDALRIVQCVNAHDELVEALELLLKWSNPIVSEHAQCVEFAKATVAKAKGEE